MPVERLLLTNDDGPKSPFLQPFVDALGGAEWIGDLQIVVPAEEQSWISQSVTRFKPLFATPRRFTREPVGTEDQPPHGYLVSGTPADCVGLGIHHLFAESAEVVVSGINLGMNAGTPFIWNSGTVGGARQAVCFGRRAIAFSSLIPSHLFDRCREEDPTISDEYRSDFERIALACTAILARLLEAPIWDEVRLLSVNVPWEIASDTKWSIEAPEDLVYRPLYTPLGDGAFAHHFHGFICSEQHTPGDLTALKRGEVSICPLTVHEGAAAIERCERLKAKLAV